VACFYVICEIELIFHDRQALEGEKNKISGRNSALTHDLNRQQSNVNQLQQEVSEKETIIQRKDEVIRDLEKRRHDQEM